MTERQPRRKDVEPLRLPFLLTTNPSVNALGERIKEATPDWEMIVMDSRRFNRIADSGYLAEIHVGHVIEKAANIDPALKDRIIRDPVVDGDETANYLFKQNQQGMLVCWKKRGPYGKPEQVAEYDHLLMINFLPVVIEVKTSNAPHSTASKKGSLAQALTQESIIKKLRPLQERLSTDRFAYVMVVNQELINPNSHFQQQFTRSGGLIVPLATPHAEFTEAAAEKLQ